MTHHLPDVDIDLADRSSVLSLIEYTAARITHNGVPRPHNSGVYVTPIPSDPVLNCAAIDYHEAEQRGYFKLDLLNMSVYSLILDQAHYDALLAQEPDWQRLWKDANWARQLVHVGNYTDLLAVMKPDSIPRMAAFISIIRPGKAHLQRRPWDEIFASVWDGTTTDGYTFKKAHAISYSALVALHMNILSNSED